MKVRGKANDSSINLSLSLHLTLNHESCYSFLFTCIERKKRVKAEAAREQAEMEVAGAAKKPTQGEGSPAKKKKSKVLPFDKILSFPLMYF